MPRLPGQSSVFTSGMECHAQVKKLRLQLKAAKQRVNRGTPGASEEVDRIQVQINSLLTGNLQAVGTEEAQLQSHLSSASALASSIASRAYAAGEAVAPEAPSPQQI